MHILLPTGTITKKIVQDAAAGYDAEIVVTGEIASFLRPDNLFTLVQRGNYDLVIVSGMCTASFAAVEKKTGVPVIRGPRHAADLRHVLSRIGTVRFSATVPADDLLIQIQRDEACSQVIHLEQSAVPAFYIRKLKIGGQSRMKVLAEIMDADRCIDIATRVQDFFTRGADIVDLGFGFDATPEGVTKTFESLDGIEGVLAADTQDPALIQRALSRADIILSLNDGNMEKAAPMVADAGACAVVVPGHSNLNETIKTAEDAGITKIITDPLLQPVGSGLVRSLSGFQDNTYPLFFGAGNVIELIDADSPGVVGLLAGMANELGASVFFCSEHSDKTTGCVSEARRATEMMILCINRPYPKDLGLDLFVIKEKRRRSEPPISYQSIRNTIHFSDSIVFDPRGNFRIGIKNQSIIAERNGEAILGDKWDEIMYAIIKDGNVSRLDHAAYLGKELYKAELALRFQRSFEQDGPF